MVRAKRLDDTRALLLLERFLTEALRTRRLRSILQGLLTKDQRCTIAQRLWIALLLTEGYSMRGVQHQTGAALATAAAVHRWLYSQNPNYRPIIPLRQRRSQTRTPRHSFPDTHRIMLGSMKHWVRGVTGADTL